MKLVLINHSHPDVPHISATRSWFFAHELANRGHQVVQICQSTPDSQSSGHAAGLRERFERHDWSQPYLIAIPPLRRQLLDLVRSRNTPSLLRKALVGYSFAVNGGVFTDFSLGARPYEAALAHDFQPDAVWGVFLDTDCWLIAQRLARLSACPWVADMKDSWDVFMPVPLRGLLARRFRDMAGCTANSEFNARVLKSQFRREATVVYSGVDSTFTQPELPLLTVKPGHCQVVIVGGLYQDPTVDQFVSGVRRWLAKACSGRNLDETQPEIIYAGADSVRAEAKLGALRDVARVQVHGYLPLAELAALCRSATVNAYMWCPTGFHHKLLELLSCGRPVIAFPGESEESRALAARCGGDLRCPASEDELIRELEGIWQSQGAATRPRPAIDDFTWAAQARVLESVFDRVVSRGAS